MILLNPQELQRYLVDDFAIQSCQKLGKKDFMMKSEDLTTKRKGKREYLMKGDCGSQESLDFQIS